MIAQPTRERIGRYLHDRRLNGLITKRLRVDPLVYAALAYELASTCEIIVTRDGLIMWAPYSPQCRTTWQVEIVPRSS